MAVRESRAACCAYPAGEEHKANLLALAARAKLLLNDLIKA